MHNETTIIRMLRLLPAIVAAAVMFAACSSDDIQSLDPTPSPSAQTEKAVSFGTYVSSSATTRAARGTRAATAPTPNLYGETTNVETLRSRSFGVFGFWTGSQAWADAGATTTPNFMYNQWVQYDKDGHTGTSGKKTNWWYEPEKFWPNGETVSGTDTTYDKVSFFSYAPYVPTSSSDSYFSSNSSKMVFSGSSAQGSPKITYTIADNPDSTIDLLWGVVPAAYATSHAKAGLTANMPYLDLTKQTVDDSISFQMKHALAKMNVIMYGNFGSTLASTDSTMVLLDTVKLIMPLARRGILDLSNGTAGLAAWDKAGYEYDSEGYTTLTLTPDIIPDSLHDIDYGTNPDGWIERYHNGLGGIRNNKEISLLRKGAYMLIPPDSTDFMALPLGGRNMTVEVSFTVQTRDQRLPKKYYRMVETVRTEYPLHSINAGYTYTLRLGLSLSAVSISVNTKEWQEPVVFDPTVKDTEKKTFDVDFKNNPTAQDP